MANMYEGNAARVVPAYQPQAKTHLKIAAQSKYRRNWKIDARQVIYALAVVSLFAVANIWLSVQGNNVDAKIGQLNQQTQQTQQKIDITNEKINQMTSSENLRALADKADLTTNDKNFYNINK